QVGDKYVQACLKEKGYVVGGEQSGHVIFLDELNTGDGFLSCVHLMNIAVDEPSLIEHIEECPVYPQILENVRFESKEEAIEALSDPKVQKVIAEVDARLGDSGRVLVRKSGTEPLVRVMSEASSESDCAEAVRQIIQAIHERNN
ncbi:MAG: phosphoglucosamine mutase, partial [Candidatus Enteromonas sp.]|nr:phosphoglucosamine mutase [Candidatus Enteromonas sp.]